MLIFLVDAVGPKRCNIARYTALMVQACNRSKITELVVQGSSIGNNIIFFAVPLSFYFTVVLQLSVICVLSDPN